MHAVAKRSDHGRFYSTDLTRPPRRRTVLITNLPRQERLICRGELNGVFSRALRRVFALKIGGPKRGNPFNSPTKVSKVVLYKPVNERASLRLG